MNRATFFEKFEQFADAPDAVKKMRDLLLELSVQGRLFGRAKVGDADNLPSGWQHRPLGEIAQFINGDRSKNYPSKAFRVADGIPFINAGHLSNGDVDLTDMDYITPEHFDRLGGGKVEAGDVLYCLRGSLGKCAVVQSIKRGAIASSLLILRPSDHVTPQFLYLFLTSPLGARMITQYDNGSAQPNLSAANVRKYIIPFPPLAEQKRIVSKVKELFSLCDELEARQTAAREKRTRVIHSALDHFTNAKDEKDFQKHSAFVLQNSSLTFNDVPALRQSILSVAVQGRLSADTENWPKEPEPVGKFSPMQNGYAFQSEWFTPDGVRLLRNANVSHGVMRWDDMACIARSRAKEFDRFALNEGDVVLSLDRPFISTGIKVARVRDEDLPCLLLQRVGRFQPDTKRLHPDYLFLFLNSPYFAGQIDPGRSNGVPHISSKQVEAARIFVPPLSDQKRIVAKVNDLMHWCDELESKLAAAQTAATHLLDATLHQILNPPTLLAT